MVFMKRFSLLVLLFVACKLSFGQSVAASNFRHWYDPNNEVELQIRPIKAANQIIVRYTLISKQNSVNKYSIYWEGRNTYVEHQGVPIAERDSVISNTGIEKRGIIKFSVPDKPWLLVAKVTNNDNQRNWTYYKLIESIYPVDGWLETKEGVITENHLSKNKEYTAHTADGKPMHASYYTTNFPAALPPFADKEGRTERFFFHDSIFHVQDGSSFTPKKEGLYLFQEDTTAARGFAYRVVKENFPKFTKMEELLAPLILVTTPEEYTDLTNAKGDKAKFDKVILTMTGDKYRAKEFMKQFFRRVELANIYFSSYKEGWKTDRGILYVVMGLPDEVSRNAGNEIWNYKNLNVRFTFVKSGSVYDPDNYVLLRDKRFTDPWFSSVDQIRKARF